MLPVPRRYFDFLPRFALSVALAYPLSGVTLALVGLTKNPSFVFHSPLEAVAAFVAGIAWFGILTPIYGGFPISDEGGVNHMNMYPYIIPTALILFFLLSRGWRWFRKPE